MAGTPEEIKNQELWLIKVPNDFPVESINNKRAVVGATVPLDIKKRLSSFDSKRGSNKVQQSWHLMAKKSSGNMKKCPFSVMLQNNSTKNTQVMTFAGELSVQKKIKIKNSKFNILPKKKLELPTDLKMRNIPFGSASTVSAEQSDLTGIGEKCPSLVLELKTRDNGKSSEYEHDLTHKSKKRCEDSNDVNHLNKELKKYSSEGVNNTENSDQKYDIEQTLQLARKKKKKKKHSRPETNEESISAEHVENEDIKPYANDLLANTMQVSSSFASEENISKKKHKKKKEHKHNNSIKKESKRSMENSPNEQSSDLIQLKRMKVENI